jgi:hypothetical protein
MHLQVYCIYFFPIGFLCEHRNLQLMNDTNLMQLMKFIDVSQLYMFRVCVPITPPPIYSKSDYRMLLI